MVGLHSDASLAPLVQKAGGRVSAMRRQLVEQAAAVAADYGTEARAWEDVRRMRRNLQQTCKTAGDFSSILGGSLNTGCACGGAVCQCKQLACAECTGPRCRPPPQPPPAPTATPNRLACCRQRRL